MNLPSQIRRQARTTRKVAAFCGASVLLLAASGCGSNGNQTANTTGQTGEQNGQPNQQFNGAGAVPGANGKVAAVDGSTAQVQSQQNGQVAVTWNGSTTFTKQVSAALADVKVGDCVFVTSADTASSSTPATKVAAATVRITEAVDGSCTPTLRGGPADGAQGSGPQLNYGGGSGPPPSGQAPGNGKQQLRGFGGAAGEVTAVSATGFTVAATMPGSDDKTTVAVTVGADTAYTTTAKGAASDVKVGVCVQATGKADDTGAVTATRISVSPAVDGECGGAFMARSGGPDGTSSTQQES